MRFQGDQRAAAQQVGFILVFAFFVILYSIWQAKVVPIKTEAIELRHHEDTVIQLKELRNGITEIAGENGGLGYTDAQALQLGTQYTPSILFIYPPPPAGSFRTTDPTTGADIILAGKLKENVSTACVANDSHYLQYRSNYNEFDAPKFRYENTVLYRYTESDAENGVIEDPIDPTSQSLVTFTNETYHVELIRVVGSIAKTSTQPTVITSRTTFHNSSTTSLDTESKVHINISSELSARVWNDTGSGDTGLLPNVSDNESIAKPPITVRRDSEFINITLREHDVTVQCSTVEITTGVE
ncbi:MAG: hypothetical protein ABEI86_06965 [Halobacteriaceae archaeon]